jgi:lambda repressor-like predicted transcriptional regulator
MVEQNDGQDSVLTFTQRKPKQHTGKFIDGRKRQAIITALANGESLRSIARRLNVSVNTVMAISEQNWQQVETRKERIAAQSERNATLAAERITDELESNKHIPLNVLVPVFGVSVDKALALRGNPTIQVDHQHQHIHAHINECSYEQLLANLPKRNVVQSEPIDNTPG